MTISITSLGIMLLGIQDLIVSLSKKDIQQNTTQHNMLDFDTQSKRLSAKTIFSINHSAKFVLCNMAPWGLYYKTLQTHNVHQIKKICNKLGFFILLITSSISLTNILAYYEICTLQHGPLGPVL